MCMIVLVASLLAFVIARMLVGRASKLTDSTREQMHYEM